MIKKPIYSNILLTINAFILIIAFNSTYAREKQDSSEVTSISIGYDVFKALIDEHKLSCTVVLNEKHIFRATGGFQYQNKLLREGIGMYQISPSQSRYPVLLYSGPTLRINYSYSYTAKAYIGINAVYKYLYYNKEKLFDANPGGGGTTYTRSENSNLYGIDLTIGIRGHLLDSKRIIIDNYYLIGYRYKHRNYTTHETYQGDHAPYRPEGFFIENQQYFSIGIGFVIGYMWEK